MSQTATSEILTLEEAANYLKLPLETIEREAGRGHIPGRRIEDTWRFLKSAIDDWLRAQDSRDVLLQQAGALKDDPYLDELLATIYRAREASKADIDDEAQYGVSQRNAKRLKPLINVGYDKNSRWG